MRATGTLLLVASAAAFGGMGIFGKLAYEEGATTGTVLAARFLVAAALFWAIALVTGRAREVTRISRRDLLLALGLGALGYAAQAGGYFAALQRLDASLLSLLVYTFPAIVAVSAIVLGRTAPSWRTGAALGLASGGLVLVLAGAASGSLDPLGTALGAITAFVYAAYILCSEGVSARVSPFTLSALVCTGAAVTLTGGGVAVGDVHPTAVSLEGWLWIAGIAVISTVAAIGLFFAGLQLVGATSASILSTVEPVVTVALAFAVFGEALGPAQLLGGLLVLAAVIAIRAPLPRRRGPRPAELRPAAGIPSRARA